MPPFKEMPILKRQVTDPDSQGGNFSPDHKSIAPETTEEARSVEFPNEARAREILDAHFGNYTAIIENLRSDGILPESISWVQKDLDMKMPEASFLETSDYEMMFVLRLFHPETYEHSVRTYLTGKEKILSDHPIGEYLRTEITKEIKENNPGETGDPLDIMYRSLLLHDMGKIAVPLFILNNTFTDADWDKIGLNNCLDHESDLCYSKRKEKEPKKRPKDLVPVIYGLNDDQKITLDQFIQNLPEGGKKYNRLSTLGEIISIHPAISKAILESAGHSTAAQIVAEHHSSEIPKDERRYKVAGGTLLFAKLMAGIVHAADFMDALLNARSYKGAFGIFLTLSELKKEGVEKGTIPKELAELWIDADIKRFQAEMDDAFATALLSDDEKKKIGGPFNYYISCLPEEQRDTERKYMKDLLDEFRPRSNRDEPPAIERRKN